MGKWLMLFPVLLIYGCNSSGLDIKAYKTYIEEEKNGLTVSKTIGELNYRLNYCSPEYLLIKELRGGPIEDKILIEKKKELDSMYVFQLRIKDMGCHQDVLAHGIYDDQNYFERVDLLSYAMEENIIMINSGDTLFPAVFHFERTYGVAPYADFMMAFNIGNRKANDFRILLNDQFFHNGLIQFNINEKSINGLPKLKTN